MNVSKFASKENYKPALSGVLFAKDKTVATDAYSLIEISTDKNLKIEEYPKVHGHSAMHGTKPFLVPATAVKDLKIPKVTPSMTALESVALRHVDDKKVQFLISDGSIEGTKTQYAPRIDEAFPDYEQLFSTSEPHAELMVNGKYLMELAKALSALSPTDRITIKMYGKNKALELSAESNEGRQKGRALLMPLNE